MAVPLPCSRLRIAPAATTRTTAAATASGSQLRSCFSAEGTNSGPVLTTGILHPLPKEYSSPPRSCYEKDAFSTVADKQLVVTILAESPPCSRHPLRSCGV